jgi:hypothetical protein
MQKYLLSAVAPLAELAAMAVEAVEQVVSFIALHNSFLLELLL